MTNDDLKRNIFIMKRLGITKINSRLLNKCKKIYPKAGLK